MNNQIAIRLKGSHVPSFKNSKMLTHGKLITNPKKQRWMKAAIDDIASQLVSSCPTDANGMVTAERLRSWIALSVPVNDSSRYLMACSWHFVTVPKREEGALILIKEVQD